MLRSWTAGAGACCVRKAVGLKAWAGGGACCVRKAVGLKAWAVGLKAWVEQLIKHHCYLLVCAHVCMVGTNIFYIFIFYSYLFIRLFRQVIII